MGNKTGLIFTLLMAIIVGFGGVYFGLPMATDLIGNKWSAFGAIVLLGLGIIFVVASKGADMDSKKIVRESPIRN